MPFSFSNFCLYRLCPELPSIPHLQISVSFVTASSIWLCSIIPSAVLCIIDFKSTSAESSVAIILGINLSFSFLKAYNDGKQFGCSSFTVFRSILYYLSDKSKSMYNESAFATVKHPDSFFYFLL